MYLGDMLSNIRICLPHSFMVTRMLCCVFLSDVRKRATATTPLIGSDIFILQPTEWLPK